MANFRASLMLVTLVLISANSANSEFENIANIIRPLSDEKTQQQAAQNVIRRLIHEKAENVAVKVNFKLPANYFKVICISIGKNE